MPSLRFKLMWYFLILHSVVLKGGGKTGHNNTWAADQCEMQCQISVCELRFVNFSRFMIVMSFLHSQVGSPQSYKGC